MKKKKIFTIIILLLLCIPIITVGASEKVSCGNVTDIPKKIPELTSWLFTIVQIAVPVILVVVGSIDLLKGVTAQKEDEIKKGQQIFVKRLIVGALIFFIIVIVKFLISLIAGDSTNNIVDCIDCFLNGCDDHKNKYQIKFMKNGGYISLDGNSVSEYYASVYGVTINLDTAVSDMGYTFEKRGYNFIGWSEEADCTSLISGQYTAYSDKTFYACYEVDPRARYEVTFIPTNGSYFECFDDEDIYDSTRLNVNVNTVLDLNNIIVESSGCMIKKDGDKFLGWSPWTSCNETLEEITVTSDRTLYSCWESDLQEREPKKVATFFLGKGYYSCNGINKSYFLVSKEANSKLDLNNITEEGCEIIHPEGYKLIGWMDDSDDATCNNPITGEITMSESIEFSACWSKQN